MKHYVARSHSHTDTQMLWKILSRPFKNKHDADIWKEFCEDMEKNKQHTFFIVSIDDDASVHKTT